MKLIFKNKSYDEALMNTLQELKKSCVKLLFEKIQNPEYKVHSLLSKCSSTTHGLRHKHKYQLPNVRTQKYKSSLCTLHSSNTNYHL